MKQTKLSAFFGAKAKAKPCAPSNKQQTSNKQQAPVDDAVASRKRASNKQRPDDDAGASRKRGPAAQVSLSPIAKPCALSNGQQPDGDAAANRKRAPAAQASPLAKKKQPDDNDAGASRKRAPQASSPSPIAKKKPVVRDESREQQAEEKQQPEVVAVVAAVADDEEHSEEVVVVGEEEAGAGSSTGSVETVEKEEAAVETVDAASTVVQGATEEEEEEEEDDDDGLSSTGAVETVAAASEEDDGLCEYERERAANIARNEAYLDSLGLGPIAKALEKKKQAPKKRKKPPAKRPATEAPRRSRRLLEVPATTTEVDDDEVIIAKKVVVEYFEEVVQVDSSAKTYLLPDDTNGSSGSCREFFDSALKRVYCTAVLEGGDIIAAAGKSGRVSLFSRKEGSDPIASFKAGSGWIGGLSFVPRATEAAFVLCAGNDGKAVLWDVSVEPPRRVSAIEAHSSGAWSLDYACGARQAATTGKDGAVCCFTVAETKLTPLRRYEGASAFGSVKDAHFNSVESNLLATASDDGSVSVWDLRVATAVNHIEAHSKATSARWRPSSNEILSAGAGEMKLWDVRMTNKVLQRTFSGHGSRRAKSSIRHPVWLEDDSFAVPGDGSDRCTVFDVASPKPKVHLHLGEDATVIQALFKGGGDVQILAALDKSARIIILDLPAAS